MSRYAGWEDYKGPAVAAKAKPSKFKNVKTERHGVTFHSKREADRYDELLLLERSGKIRGLRRQVKYSLDVNGQHICAYFSDFGYLENVAGEWVPVAEDLKGGAVTRVFTIKAKLMKAIHGITIRETR